MTDLSKTLVIKTLFVYGITHALVDAACAGIVFADFNRGSDFLFIVVLYNVLGFGLQPLLGELVDKAQKPVISAIIGCALTAFAAVTYKFTIVAIVLAGVGNALFHVSGGIVCLNMSNKKAAIPGIYVAPGTIGLFIGTLIGKSGHFSPYPFVLLFVTLMIFIYKIKAPQINYDNNIEVKHSKYELIILLLLISISIRSFVGMAVVFPWKTNTSLLYVLIFSVFLGKALGGVFADKFGWIKITILGLAFSVLSNKQKNSSS